MTKKIQIRTLKSDDGAQIVTTRTAYKNKHQEAQDSGNPDEFRFLAEAAEVDNLTVTAPNGVEVATLEGVHVFVIQTEE